MAYPYEHKSTYNRPGETLLFKFNEAASVGNTTHLFTVDLPYGAYSIGINVWYTGVTAAKTMTVAAFIDHAQTTMSTNYKLFSPGIASSTSAMTNASSAGVNGKVIKILNDVIGSGDIIIAAHGIRLQVVANTNAGDIDIELVAARRS